MGTNKNEGWDAVIFLHSIEKERPALAKSRGTRPNGKTSKMLCLLLFQGYLPPTKNGVEPKRPSRPVNITSLVRLSTTVPNTIVVSWTAEIGRVSRIWVLFKGLAGREETKCTLGVGVFVCEISCFCGKTCF